MTTPPSTSLRMRAAATSTVLALTGLLACQAPPPEPLVAAAIETEPPPESRETRDLAPTPTVSWQPDDLTGNTPCRFIDDVGQFEAA